MSEAFRCDRCSEFRIGSPEETLTYANKPGNVDLCEDCARELDEFLKGDADG